MRLLDGAAVRTGLGAVVLLVLLGLLCGFVGARINTSRSIPVGLYWTSAQAVEKGAYVMFCPPHRQAFALGLQRGYIRPGPCPGGYGYLMKQVAAVEGDEVAVGRDGVRVNGRVLPFSAPLERDLAGDVLPQPGRSRFVLGDGELLLMTDVSATSFDGRYFGPVHRSQVVSSVVPVLTW